MPTYRVRYAYTTRESDYIDVEAADEYEAEDVAYDSCFEDDMEIYDVEEI